MEGSTLRLRIIKNQGISLSGKEQENVDLLVQSKEIIKENKNALNSINELAQFNKIPIEFILIGERGEAHDKTFRVRLNLGEEVYQSSGKTIKDAKRKVALNALSNTKHSRPPVKSREEVEREIQQLTPTVHLNNIAGKLGIKVEYFNEAGDNVFIDYADKYLYYSLDSSSRAYMSKLNETNNSALKTPTVPNDAHHGPYRVRVDVGDESFIGTGWTVQAARHDAAEHALEKFKQMSLKDADECLSAGQLCNKLNTKSPISLVYEVAGKQQWDVAFDVISESGPAHKRQFVTRCTVSELTADGEGTSKKASKKKAAEAMLKMLDTVQSWELINVKGVTNDEKKKKKRKKKKISRPGIVDQAAINVLDAFSGIIAGNKNDNGGPGIENRNVKDKGPRGELLDLGKEIGIDIKFSSYQDEDHTQHGSLVTLDTDPTYHCYSKDSSPTTAEDNAALNALKFLKHVGLDNILIPLKNPDDKKIILLDHDNKKVPSNLNSKNI